MELDKNPSMCFSESVWFSDLMLEQENQVEFLSDDLMKTLALIGQHVMSIFC